jgi:hypothetical protein
MPIFKSLAKYKGADSLYTYEKCFPEEGRARNLCLLS